MMKAAAGLVGKSGTVAGGMVFLVLALVLVGAQWAGDTVRPDNLVLTVPKVASLSWLESRYTYLYLHLFTIIPVFALSFDRKVAYYRQWRFLFPAIVVVAAVFILWDVYFTARGVWGFNHDYLLDIFWLGLPLEEWLFFFTVPFACVFIYACLNAYIERDLIAPAEPWISYGLIVVFLATGLLYWSHMYTATTFVLAGLLLLFHVLFADGRYRGRFYLAYLVSWIPFLLVNGVLTGGFTNEPVVIYNPEEFLGVRIVSVPLDDSVYSFVLLLGTVTLFEFFRKKAEPNPPSAG